MELPVAAKDIKLFENLNHELPVDSHQNHVTLPIGKRRYLRFDLPENDVLKLFLNAKIL